VSSYEMDGSEVYKNINKAFLLKDSNTNSYLFPRQLRFRLRWFGFFVTMLMMFAMPLVMLTMMRVGGRSLRIRISTRALTLDHLHKNDHYLPYFQHRNWRQKNTNLTLPMTDSKGFIGTCISCTKYPLEPCHLWESVQYMKRKVSNTSSLCRCLCFLCFPLAAASFDF